MTVNVVLLSGTVGSGKTAVASAMNDLLAEREVPNAAIDLDALIWQWPPDSSWNNDLMFENLAAIWPNFAARGVRHLVLARVVESRDELTRYSDALPEADILVGRVVAPLEVRRQRLVSRMSPGPSRDWHLNRTVELDAILDDAKVEDFVVTNGEQDLRDVAAEALHSAGWLQPGRSSGWGCGEVPMPSCGAPTPRPPAAVRDHHLSPGDSDPREPAIFCG